VIGPLSCDGKAAAVQPTEDKSVDASNTPLFEYEEALTSKWMERMTDLCPS
jgi:hypothetical protein